MLLALAGPAPAAQGPPNFPSAVPEAPGATHPQVPSDVEAALAIERSYSSYGAAPPVPEDEASLGGGGDGIDPAPFALALAGALVLGLALGALAPMATARRRERLGKVS